MKSLLCVSLLSLSNLPIPTGTAAPAPVAPPRSASPGVDLEKLLAGRPVVNGPLSLEQAVSTAVRESPVIRGAVEEVEAAAGRLEAARAERRPWVSANLFASGGNNANIVAGPAPTQPQMLMNLPSGSFADANLMVMFPLFTSGRLRAMVRSAAAQRDVSRAEMEVQRQEVALMTRMAYREVQARRSVVGVWLAKLDEDQERLRLDRDQVREGRLPAFMVQRGEAEVAMSQQEVTNAQRDGALSLLQLRSVMGVHPASKIEVPGALSYEPSDALLSRLAGAPVGSTATERAASGSVDPAAIDLSALVRTAGRQRAELQAAAQRTRAAQGETDSLRGSYGPQVNLFAMGDALTQAPHAGFTAGVAASVPLFAGGQRRARLQTAEAERRRQEQDQLRLALQVQQEVESALLNLRAAEQNVRTTQASVKAAREEYLVAKMRYEAGRSIFVEVLDSLTARVRAESNEVQALFQYGVAQDRLRRAVGEPVPSDIRITADESPAE